MRYGAVAMDGGHRTYRRQFLASAFKAGALLALGWTVSPRRALSYGEKMKQPDTAAFTDDGTIPNNRFPLLLYRGVINAESTDPAAQIEVHFAANNWTNSWRNGIYPFHHYHSNTHEVLGVFNGTALLHLGGEAGGKIAVQEGDIIVIPAGVGHKCIRHSEDFTVVGAYPDGLEPDLNKGEKGDRPKADENIAAVPLPATDPLLGTDGGLLLIWI